MTDYVGELVLTDGTRDGLCGDFVALVDEVSLHTGHPGSTGANESAVAREDLTWGAPEDGVASGTATFSELSGDYPWLGLWGSGTFRGAVRVDISNSAARDVSVMVTHEVPQ